MQWEEGRLSDVSYTCVSFKEVTNGVVSFQPESRDEAAD